MVKAVEAPGPVPSVDGVTPFAAELGRPLLEAKLSIPQPRSGWVSRSDIIDAARVSDRRVVAVTAPARYGKTTLMAHWALGEDRCIGWVSLDRYDDDPAVLITLLASAYARVSPGNDDLAADVRGGIPEGSQLVAASRFEQPHLPRMRASGDAVELDGSHLAMQRTRPSRSSPKSSSTCLTSWRSSRPSGPRGGRSASTSLP